MKRTAMIGLVAAGLMISGATASLLAQNGSANGRGYGGPPKTEEERAARQAACQEQGAQCQGPCVTGQPHGPGRGMGWGARNGARNGGGFGYRHGLRDGTGPRSANGTCPLNTPAQPKK